MPEVGSAFDLPLWVCLTRPQGPLQTKHVSKLESLHVFQVDLLVVLLAAAIHDIGHPATNNAPQMTKLIASHCVNARQSPIEHDRDKKRWLLFRHLQERCLTDDSVTNHHKSCLWHPSERLPEQAFWVSLIQMLMLKTFLKEPCFAQTIKQPWPFGCVKVWYPILTRSFVSGLPGEDKGWTCYLSDLDRAF